MKRIVFLIGVVSSIYAQRFATVAVADTFGSGTESFDIEFVTIGDPGNPFDDDPNPAGAVAYEYRIGKYEISEQMIDKANALGLGITKNMRGPDKPATSISWYEAAHFVNWLNTTTGHQPAYKFSSPGRGSDSFLLWTQDDVGFDPNNRYRNRLAKYFLPSIDEWHKAAYYDPIAGHYWDYPTGSDAVPDGIDFVGDPNFDAVFYDGGLNPEPNDVMNVGLLSPYGTAGQGGNVEEWVETAFDRANTNADEQRSIQGGSWGSLSNIMLSTHTGIGISPSHESNVIGFRVVVVPEPSSVLSLIGAVLVFWLKRQNGSRHDSYSCRDCIE
jgi:Sulfatase-modifying factor enzyme 1